MSDHAKFSPSAAHRWMSCPGSIQSCADIPNTSSWQADLGTRLHAVAADVLTGKGPHTLSGEEAEIVDAYVGYVGGLSCTPATKTLIEQRVSLDQDVWGTCDAIVIQPYVLHIVDFKTGSQRVDARNNAQLLTYAAAALTEFNVLPSPIAHEVRPVDVRLHICQPSIGWTDEWVVPVSDVRAFAKKVERAVKSACSPSPDYAPSEEACKYCPARNSCRPRAEFNIQMAVADFALADPLTLTRDDLARILPQVPQIVAWASSIQEFATSRALEGDTPKGYKLVQSGGARKWVDVAKTVEALIEAGLSRDMACKITPIGIGDATKLLGRNHSIFAEYTVKGEVKPVLAAEDDKRKDWNGAQDF